MAVTIDTREVNYLKFIMRLSSFCTTTAIVGLALLTGTVTAPAIASDRTRLENREPNSPPRLTRQFIADQSFANSSQTHPGATSALPMITAQQADILLSSSVVVNPEFDGFVRRHPYVIYTYRNYHHARLLALARRQMTYMEMKRAITEILNRPR